MLCDPILRHCDTKVRGIEGSSKTGRRNVIAMTDPANAVLLVHGRFQSLDVLGPVAVAIFEIAFGGIGMLP